MRTTDDQELPDQIRNLARSIALPALLAALAIGAGTAGYLLHLPTTTAYRDASMLQILSEGFFRSLGFLVLGMGTTFPENSLSFALLTLGRAAGFVFFFYAAVAGIGIVFAEQIRPLRIEAWSLIGSLPGFDDTGHIIICGVSDDGYAIAKELLDNGRHVAAIDPTHSERLAELKNRGAIVFEADPRHESLLTDRARLHRAAIVYLMADKDAINGELVERIDQRATASNWSQTIDITARIDSRRLRRSFHRELNSTDAVHLRTYDVPEATARELLATHSISDIDSVDERIHVWIVGWTSLTEVLVDQLLHLMHYPSSIDRQVTVITETPTEVELDIATMFPGIDPDWWDDQTTSEFVRTLFPAVDIQRMPGSDMELLSEKQPLYDTLEQNDKLTIVADDIDERSLRALISTWGPKLDELARVLDLDARLTYRSPADTNWDPRMAVVETSSYTEFGDGCSLSSVRGDERDCVAKQLALVYNILHADASEKVISDTERISTSSGASIDSVIDWLTSIPHDEREAYMDAVWRNLPEYQRESNRYAADHAMIKHQMATVLSTVDRYSDSQMIEKIAESEHRRWCAEKILDGWEPLPSTKRERWETKSGQESLRNQQYHPDIRSVEVLCAESDGAWDKDVSQVGSILNHPEFFGHKSYEQVDAE